MEAIPMNLSNQLALLATSTATDEDRLQVLIQIVAELARRLEAYHVNWKDLDDEPYIKP